MAGFPWLRRHASGPDKAAERESADVGNGGGSGRKRLGRRTAILGSAACLLAGLGLLASIGWFYLRSDIVGHSLIHRQEAIDAQARRQTSSTAACHTPTPTAGSPRGLVEAPSIGLVAPVLDGTGGAQLDVAVGHDPYSAWPGSSGTVVLSAHDVSWFSQIDRLAIGATIRYVAPCQTFTYTVTSHQVVAAGSPVYNTAQPRLVLDTCYPLNALYITPNRYLVYASLTKVANAGQVASLPPSSEGTLTSPLPPALAASVSQRVTSTAPLGQLTMGGSPSSAWTSSLQPIRGEASVLTLYFGALEVAQEGDTGTWSQIAPSVPFSAVGPLDGATIAGYPSAVNPTINAVDDVTTGASINAGVELDGGPDPGDYTISMTSQVENGELVITAWSMTPQ
jgi:sortase A